MAGLQKLGALLLMITASRAYAADTFPRYDTGVALDGDPVTSANVSVGDVNGDGHSDIVIANGRHWPLISRVFLGDGHGRFSAGHNLGETAFRSYSGRLADMDSDGDLDVVLSNDAPDAKLVYLNDGKGYFHAGPHYGLREWPSRHTTIADLDGDGLPDLVVANRSSDVGNFICRNTRREQFEAECSSFSKEPATSITAVDINDDDSIDLVVPHRDGGQSYVYLGAPKAKYSSLRRVPFGPSDATIRMTEVSDFDGDSLLDIVAIDDERRSVTLYFGRKGGTFSEGMPIDNGTAIPYALAATDLNGDGKIDIVVGNVAASSTVYFNDGSGHRYTPVRFGDIQGVAFGLAFADFNSDGLLDIVVARSNATNVVYFAGR